MQFRRQRYTSCNKHLFKQRICACSKRNQVECVCEGKYDYSKLNTLRKVSKEGQHHRKDHESKYLSDYEDELEEAQIFLIPGRVS
ncbi:hypothetical protein KIN20_012736 [Parelaphostrongylus tenuis]|uniref:Uncharacterized protein n=1 Tax=Parelaphostrongylus tenuis TaxID=148309 RepID=A0AAD5QN01_PARTN|nr:hypothetical protein KIN20_012736 [Parelaphostrongylus tenuis]